MVNGLHLYRVIYSFDHSKHSAIHSFTYTFIHTFRDTLTCGLEEMGVEPLLIIKE